MNRAFIIDNPTVTIGPDPDDVPAGSAITVTCDLTRAEITNNVNMVDTGTLCGPAQQPGKIDYTIELDGYQGWDKTAPEALARYLWEHQRKQVPFSLVTKNAAVSAANPIFTGILVCVPPEVGGTREEAAVFTAACPIVGTPTMSDTAPAGYEAQEATTAPTAPASGSGSSSGTTTAAA